MGTPLLKGPTNAAVRAWRRFGGGPNVCGLPYARYSARLRPSANDAIRPIDASNAAVRYVRTTSTPALGPARAAEKLRWCTLPETHHRVGGARASASREAVPNLNQRIRGGDRPRSGDFSYANDAAVDDRNAQQPVRRRRGERGQIEPKERFGREARTQDRRQRAAGRCPTGLPPCRRTGY